MVRRAAPAWALGLCLIVSGASAQDDPEERARELFAAGREDVARGDLEAACDKFRQSHAIAPDAVGPLLNVADCDERAGKTATAWRAFRRGAALAGDDPERRDYATRRAEALAPRVPLLLLELPDTAPAGTTVTRDGRTLSPGELGRSRASDPGTYRYQVSAPGHVARTHVVELREGDRVTLLLELGDVTSASPAPPAPVPDRPDPVAPAPRAMSATTLAGWIVGGAGVASLVVGAATGVAVAVNAGIYDDHCDDGGRCDDEGLAAASRGEPLAIVSPVALVVGAVGIGIAIPLLLTGSDGTSAALRVWTRGDAGFVGLIGAL